ncbi:MAG: hypothetical protein AAFV53_31960 [Myxococcota bacterium]
MGWVLVPAVEHRVGVLDLRTDRGLSRHTPAPFLICDRPLTREQVGLRSRPAEPWRGSRAEAMQVLEELGPGLTLPTFLQWQCALHGPDGRLRPWGMGAGRGPSPWACWSGDGPELVAEGRALPGWQSGDDGPGLLRPVSRPMK